MARGHHLASREVGLRDRRMPDGRPGCPCTGRSGRHRYRHWSAEGRWRTPEPTRTAAPQWPALPQRREPYVESFESPPPRQSSQLFDRQGPHRMLNLCRNSGVQNTLVGTVTTICRAERRWASSRAADADSSFAVARSSWARRGCGALVPASSVGRWWWLMSGAPHVAAGSSARVGERRNRTCADEQCRHRQYGRDLALHGSSPQGEETCPAPASGKG